MDFKLYLENNGQLFEATNLCEGSVKVETQRIGSPGKIEFNIIRDGTVNFVEGNGVFFYVNNTPIFRGFVFSKSRDKEQIISVIAYDQLRYLKNKYYYKFEDKKASEILQAIAGDFELQIGEVHDTEFVIPLREEDNQALMDIIYTALDLTLIHSKKLFVLYDDFGSLCLKNIENMILPLMYDPEYGNIYNYSYKTDIDSDSYNSVVLVKDNKESGKREIYRELDSNNMKQWGILQHFEKVNEEMNEAQIKQRTSELLILKNRVKKTLSVELLGDISVRAGNSLYVHIPAIGETNINQIMLVSKCTHTFSNNEHSMKLELEGNLT